jgi:hypothetical protein
MHPARHRALREVGAFSRQMADHWSALAERVPAAYAKPLRDGATEEGQGKTAEGPGAIRAEVGA